MQTWQHGPHLLGSAAIPTTHLQNSPSVYTKVLSLFNTNSILLPALGAGGRRTRNSNSRLPTW